MMLKTKMKLALGTALIVTPIQAWAQDTAADAPQTTRMTLDRMVISAGTENAAGGQHARSGRYRPDPGNDDW